VTSKKKISKYLLCEMQKKPVYVNRSTSIFRLISIERSHDK
jgi:hypothetical protein